MLAKLRPSLNRPILLLASTAWMKRDDGSAGITQKISGELTIFLGRINYRRATFQRQAELFQRLGQLKRCMFSRVDWLRGTCKKHPDSTAFQVFPKNPVGIKEIAHDQIEAGKVRGPLRGKHRTSGEERSERSGFDRAGRVGVKSPFGQRGNGAMTENLEARLRKRVAEELDCRQSENEIANRAA